MLVYIELIGVVLFIIALWIILKRSSISNKALKKHNQPVPYDQMEERVNKMAVEHAVSKKKSIASWPVPRLDDNYQFILSVYTQLNDDIKKNHDVSYAAEWILDNFYLIEEQVKQLRCELSKKSYSRLPILKHGSFKAHSRIFAITMELVAISDGQVDEAKLIHCLNAYQKHNKIFDREIWALPAVIKIALLENIRNICEKIKKTQIQWNKADYMIEKLLGNNAADEENITKMLQNMMIEEKVNLSFIEHLSYRLRMLGSRYIAISKYINEYLDRQEKTMGTAAQQELGSQSTVTVSAGNNIASLKYFATFDWSDLFEAVSFVGQILSKDPDGTYPLMDLATRNAYRSRIESLSSGYGIDESCIASKAVELAKTAYMARDEDAQSTWHVGYYLIGKGADDLHKALKVRTKWISATTRFARNHPQFLYVGSIILITLLLTGIAAQYAAFHSFSYQWAWVLIAIVAVFIPSSEIAVSIVNWLAAKTLKPAIFPALELKDGIPDSMSTMIVIPTLLPDQARVKEILDNMETHYLSNRDKNLCFALVGAFKDSDAEVPADLTVIDTAMRGVKALNEKYMNDGGTDVFYYFHRTSQYNPVNKKWIGWERKRGALMEFNDLLLGCEDTSFSYRSNSGKDFSKIKYVITLDSDTILPIDMAKRMIATMAHPLNKPVIDPVKGIVVDGYGLMQPRVDFDSENSGKSPFSKVYTGQIGIDPYSSAISDVYQDMFGEGIYTGKGIYDLKVFQQILKNAIPENKILSHDLYEGSYVRAALVTNLKLVESYPTKYNSLSARLYRWIRGDWQLLPFLSNKIPSGTGMIRNPLSLLSKWKIFDNLRRSLVTPALMVLIALGLSILPGSLLIWLAYVLVALLFPLISSTMNYVLSGGLFREKIKSYIPIIVGLKALLYQTVLTFLFLPYQAYSMAKAAVLTLWRVYISQKNMLEWVTSADSEANQNESLSGYYGKMHASIWVALIVAILMIAFNPPLVIVSVLLFAAWAISPFVAYRISQEYRKVGRPVSEKDKNELGRIARYTWRYFEEFADISNNYLAPDNYQQEPFRGIAARTSPTNIGLGLLSVLTARDMGYIGNFEMADSISNTITTIESLQKWNGHLYNWYDTKTLKPLNPRYISTVDSGNLVCYLTTLVQGLKSFLAHPIADQKCISGIMDTLACAQHEGFEAAQLSKYLNESMNKPFNLVTWSRILEELSQEGFFSGLKDSLWREKIERMIKLYKTELSEIAPWAELLANIPLNLTMPGQSVASMEEIITSFNTNLHLRDIPAACAKALDFFETLSDNERETTQWLGNIRTAFVQSRDTAQAFISSYKVLMERVKSLSKATRFSPLYDEKKQLFSIGYSIKEKKLSRSYYDLLASEARQTSFIAIARGEIPATHWFKMGRTLTVMDGYKGLVSWTGTMFEYLMPLLIMKSYKNTLLDETYAFAVRNQKKYGIQRGIPWGTSESGYYSLGNNLDYKYKAIGVPWLGLKRGLIGDAVAAPYATFLALMVDPEGAIRNLAHLKADGMEGTYGFYEAADYTQKRLTNRKIAIVKSFMAHHQGMSLLAIDNFLNKNIMQKRFHADPEVRSARLLLQEKIPENVVFTKEEKEKVTPIKGADTKESNLVRKYHKPDPLLPKAHILTNGDYSAALTDRGTGYSKSKGIAVTRWREDSTLDQYGMFCFLRNVGTDAMWSNTYAPLNILPERYEVIFTSDKAQFKRVDENIETTTEIVVASGDNVEIRRISLKNLGDRSATLELTSYFEVVLAAQAQDVAHPAFSNLFVKTEYFPDKRCIVANRRPRSNEEKTLCAANMVVLEEDADVQFETDRMKFIGRGRSIASPAGMERGFLSDTAGPVLDPVMSLRARVSIESGKRVSVSFVTAVSNASEPLLGLVEKYSTPEAVEAAFYLAKVRSQLEARHLNVSDSAMTLYEDMISHILYLSPLKRQYQDMTAKNIRGQSSLWTYGISGDLPIVLSVINNTEDTALVFEVMKAHEYWWLKGLEVDLVIIANMENSYCQPFHDFISDVESGQTHGKGKAFIININEMPAEDVHLLYAAARIVIKDNGRTLREQMTVKQEQLQYKSKRYAGKPKKYSGRTLHKEPSLSFFNGLGGFRQDGSEYVIRLTDGENTPAPWINVVANSGFGFLVSESGSSYTWCGNSRENKLTPWSNDPVSDSPGEALYIRDNDTGEIWTVTALPIREYEPYKIRHGFGYSVFEHDSHGIRQSLVQFVPVNDTVKISMLNLVNDSAQTRSLSLTYYMRPVLGVSDQVTAMHVKTRQSESGALLMENPYNEEFSGHTGFLDVSVAERHVTGDRKEFFGSGGIASPDGLQHEKLSGTLGIGLDPCAVIQVDVTLMPNESADVVFLLGMCEHTSGVEAITKKYTVVSEAKKALDEVKKFWQEKLSVIQVDTPQDSFDLMMNGWLQYQVLSCRLWAKSAFYQSGGAFGFRDQLQDSLSVVNIWPKIVRSQILLHAKHQFQEGDVQHWWHEPWGRGTRTRCSDDLLWLPYVTAEYIKVTGDEEILKTQIPFLEDEVLKDCEDERYGRPRASAQTATLFDHCILAVDKALKFGIHGLPLIGSGDWNDGMNSIGEKGIGESVWLGWFMISVLKSFAPVCVMMGETSRAEKYIKTSEAIARSIEKSAWDGEWYRRAYFDDGKILGSKLGSECRIDAIAQSWAVISGASDMKRAAAAMNSLEEHLVDRENGIIKLLTPPFDCGELEPGYIKGYLPGVRENGGQYTHAAAWAIMAWARLGEGDKAWECFQLINPINHTLSAKSCSTYKLEPYVMAADVYSLYPNAGRGGWSWYTGSAGWMYKTGLEDMLGFRKKRNTITIDPCIPRQWTEYAIRYRYLGTLYQIRIYNPKGVSKGVSKVFVDGNIVEGNTICLVDDGATHDVEVIMSA